MRTCQSCGAALETGDTFCSQCGAATAPSHPQGSPTPDAGRPPPRAAQQSRWTLAAVGGILLAGILAVVFWPRSAGPPKSPDLVKQEASAQRAALVTGKLERAKGAAVVLPVESPTPRTAETAPVAARPAPSAAIRPEPPRDTRPAPKTPPLPAPPPTPAPSIAPRNLPAVKPIPVRGNVEAPRVITKVQPAFPSWARDRGLPTYVVLELVIDREGRVRSATPLRSVDPELDRLAAEAARQWTFEPARSRGAAVDVLYNVAVHFEQ